MGDDRPGVQARKGALVLRFVVDAQERRTVGDDVAADERAPGHRVPLPLARQIGDCDAVWAQPFDRFGSGR